MQQLLLQLGVFVSLVLCLFLFWREIKRTSASEEKTIDVLFASLFLGIISGRGLYIILNWSEFEPTILKILLFYAFPGISELGFWLGFLLSWAVYSKKQKLDFYQLMKMLILPLLLAGTLLSGFYYLQSAKPYFIYKGAAFLLLLLLYRLVIVGFYKREKISLKGLWMFLITGLSLFNFVVDFFKDEAVYLFGQKVLRFEQLFYGAVFLWGTVWWFKNLLFKKK